LVSAVPSAVPSCRRILVPPLTDTRNYKNIFNINCKIKLLNTILLFIYLHPIHHRICNKLIPWNSETETRQLRCIATWSRPMSHSHQSYFWACFLHAHKLLFPSFWSKFWHRIGFGGYFFLYTSSLVIFAICVTVNGGTNRQTSRKRNTSAAHCWQQRYNILVLYSHNVSVMPQSHVRLT